MTLMTPAADGPVGAGGLEEHIGLIVVKPCLRVAMYQLPGSGKLAVLKLHAVTDGVRDSVRGRRCSVGSYGCGIRNEYNERAACD